MTMLLVVVAVLVGSFFNATSGVMQRVAAGHPNARELFSAHFIQVLVTNKLWMFGSALQVAGFILQAVSLKEGSLILVEPLWTTDLIFLMLILHFKMGVPTGRREWGAAVAICAGLSGFLILSDPRGGHIEFKGVNWAVTSALLGSIIVACAIIVRRSHKSSAKRALIAGIAAGLNFAMTAAFTKLTVQQLDKGVLHVITSWPVYALMVSGIVSLVTMQSAYGAGPLAVSTPAMEIIDPLISVGIGIVLFGDIINLGVFPLLGQALCGIIMMAGIVLLAGSDRIQRHAKL